MATRFAPPRVAAPKAVRRHSVHRRGIAIISFAMMSVVLLGMVGLVIDGGILMATHRQAQNRADAAAMAAAFDKMRGKSDAQATATAVAFVTQHNPDVFDDTTPNTVVNIPPAVSAYYAGAAGYVEVIVTSSLRTFFIQILGIGAQQTVQARAVAGYEARTAGEGVAVLDPDARPGLKISGGGRLVVKGLVVDNSEGGGVDENGVPVDNGNTQFAASVSNNGEMRATDIHIVGGVNDPSNFLPWDPLGPNPLHANSLPIPDPLLGLATPATVNGEMIAHGVDPSGRGSPQATNTNLMLNDPSGGNYIEVDPVTAVETMILNPGIYTSIQITGGNVRFVPGIYVIRPNPNTQNALIITGGNVLAEGIMFYATGHNYNETNGNPDVNDQDKKPPHADGAEFGGITLNAGMKFSPIDLDEFFYEPPVAEAFDGMLFYQRRRDAQGLDIQGDSSEGLLAGTLYAKWAPVKISGQGTYDAQFIVGSMDITGLGDVTLNFAGKKLGKAPQVFLVE